MTTLPVSARPARPSGRGTPVLRALFTKRAAGLATAFVLLASSAGAQATAEGTVITNTASVSFTDANGNTYTPVTGSVNVTVGFTAGVDVIAAAATLTPSSPSTSNDVSFTVQNTGNGTDSVTVSQSISVGSIITVTGYKINGGSTYATLALLNAALSTTVITAGTSITLTVVYDVASGVGGQSTVLQLTAASRRTPATTDMGQTTVTPTLTSGVSVTPDGSQLIQRVPSNGTQYTFTFTVTNNGTGPDGFNLVASKTGTAVTIVSVNGVGGASTSISNLAAAASQTIAVIYTIGAVANGVPDTLRLTATSTSNGAVNDVGFADITVIRPVITVTKAAYLDNQTTLLTPTDRVLPSQFIQYRITVTNGGGAPASSVHVDDVLPAELTYNTMTGDLAGWTFSGSGNTRAADLSGTLAAGASRFFWIRVQVK